MSIGPDRRPPGLMLLDRIPRFLLTALACFASGTLAAVVAVHLGTFVAPGLANALQAATIALFLLIFLTFGPAVAIAALCNLDGPMLVSALPAAVRVSIYLVAAYAFLVSYWTAGHMTDPAAARVYQSRLFTGGELVFSLMAAVIAIQIRRLRGGGLSPTGTGQSERASWRLPPPFSRVVKLETALNPDDCARRLRDRTWQPAGRQFARPDSGSLLGTVSREGFDLGPSGPRIRNLVRVMGRIRPGPPTEITMVATLTAGTMASLFMGTIAVAAVDVILDRGVHPQVTVAFAVIALLYVAVYLAHALFRRWRLVTTVVGVLREPTR